MFEVRFPSPRWDSKAGSRYIVTTGVSVGIGDPITLRPITTRGEAAVTCEIVVARSAIPELIAALQNASEGRYGCFDNETRQWIGVDGKPVSPGQTEPVRVECETPGAVYDFIHETLGDQVFRSCRYEPRLVNPVVLTMAAFTVKDTDTGEYLSDLDGNLKFDSRDAAAYHLVKTYGADAARGPRFEVEPA